MRRSAALAAVRFAQPAAKRANLRALSSSALAHLSGGDNRGASRSTSTACAPSASVQRLLPGAPSRKLASQSQKGQIAEVDSSEMTDERAKKDAAVDSHELHEKWGWTTADPLYWPYKIMGVFSTKNTNALSSARMLQTCLNNADCPEWYNEGKISNEFLPKLLWLSTNVWLMSRRLLREGERGKKVQELLFDELWRETKRQMRSIEVSEMMLKKYLGEAQQHTFMTLVQYDHAYTLESRTERMDVLTSALWRGIFKGDESIKEPHVRVLAEYIDSELADIYAVDVSDFFAVCIELAPPPTAELKAASKTSGQGKGKGGAAKSSSAKKKDAARGVGGIATESAAAAVGGGGLGERVHHGDFDGGGEGRKGRWRACLAESGKVYYWHTVSREVTWDRPADSEAYVPSTMPKTDTKATTTEA